MIDLERYRQIYRVRLIVLDHFNNRATGLYILRHFKLQLYNKQDLSLSQQIVEK